MTSWLSRPIESLLQEHQYPFHDSLAQTRFSLRTDILVVGSGYGAAMATLALLENITTASDAGKPEIWVFERGSEYVPDDFPKTMGELPGFIGGATVNSSALWDVRAGPGVVTITGRGLGGTSLVNANVAVRPDKAVLDHWPIAAPPQADSWHQRLSACFGKIEQLLGVSPVPPAALASRFDALSQTSRALGSEATAAPVSINFKGPSAHSADHAPCNLCGNCVIGCHSGAKGSLNMNAWPLARQLGACLYAGIEVRSLVPNPDGSWLVLCSPVNNPTETVRVIASTVVLSAGTLGSTEILMRSDADAALGLSPKLGKGFSANGDALVMGVGQQKRIGEAASIPGQQPPSTQPGPTITGLARITVGSGEGSASITLEDAVVPYPLQQIWQELLVNQSLLRRFADGDESAWHKQHPEHDRLAISDDLTAHSQTLLIMGLDDGNGDLELHEDRLRPVWRHGDEGDYFHRLDSHLRLNESAAFDGGLYMPNMLSQPLPPGFDGVVEGAGEIAGRLLSVHPLGGCCMGGNIEAGVVNTRGQVFTRKTASGVYDNLYVLDGAIIPGAIGTNPFLTIAALSYVLANQISVGDADRERSDVIAVSRPPVSDSFPALQTEWRRIPTGSLHPVPDPKDLAVTAAFNERLVCHLDHGKRSFFPWSRETALTAAELNTVLGKHAIAENSKALVLDIRFLFVDGNSLDKWLQAPQSPLTAHATLFSDTTGSVLTTVDDHLSPILQLQGHVTLGLQSRVGVVRLLMRTMSAVWRYARYRSVDIWVRLPRWVGLLLLGKRVANIRFGGTASVGTVRKKNSLLADFKVFLRIASIQARRRYLVYDLQSEDGLRLSGRKTLGYGRMLPDLLRALMVLPATMAGPGGSGFARKKLPLQFELDAVRITQGAAPLQIISAPNAPAAVLAVSGLGLYFLRMIMQTHFWSFAAPSYRQFASRAAIESTDRLGRFYEPPDHIFYGKGGKRHSTRRETYEHGGQQDGKLVPLCRLIRYQPAEGETAGRKALLLVHGLAHSSRVFWTDTVSCNFVQYFLAHNYDVWILDHRASANYIRTVTPAHTWDDIALKDLPWAVTMVFKQINRLAVPGTECGVHVFSHCIGAGAVAMAVLGGRLDYAHMQPDGTTVQKSMLASLVPHAVTPWLTTSGENRARANVWALIKDLEPIQVIEPLPHNDPELIETLYDRLGALAMNDDERSQWSSLRGFADWRGPNFAQSIYTRYTIFWGRQWHNANIGRKTRYAFAGMIGPVPIGVMQQVYFSLTRGLLSDHGGANRYVREENFARHWTFPTCFLHGNRNTVFDMESSKHSADQLTRLRIKARAGNYTDAPLSPEDYAREKVWIEMIEDYGHMDMIFSKSADKDVFPRLHAFFKAADDNRMFDVYQQRFQDPATRQWFRKTCASNSHVKPAVIPLTGPIISRPERGPDGQARIRLWVEAQDFTALPALGLSMIQAQAGVCGDTDAALTAVPCVGYISGSRRAGVDGPNNWKQEFWLYDYEFNAHCGGKHYLSLNYLHSGECKKISAPLSFSEGTGSDVAVVGVELNWQDMPWFRRLFVDEPTSAQSGALTLLLGSCLYPGFPFERDKAMAVFDGMFRHVTARVDEGLRGADSVVLLGDQIYADATADLFDPKAYYEKYRNPYRIVFGSRSARRLMSHIPCYFAVDDHEFSDNWRGTGGTEPDDFIYARRMAWLYQMHQHTTLNYSEMRLWYDFDNMGCPVFVFDTRMQRTLTGGDNTRLLDTSQWTAFEAWLVRSSDKPTLFLATGSPLAPVSRALIESPALAAYDDGLLAYPVFLSKLIACLARHAPGKRIVWLSGDPHFSSVAELTLTCEDDSVNLTHVCCSGLYAPLPFANANVNDFAWRVPFSVTLAHGKKPLTVSGEQVLLSNSLQHFVRLDLQHGSEFQLRLQAFGADGEVAGLPYTLTGNARTF